jgi:hypothetical protein
MKGCTKGCEEDIHQSNGVGMREEQFNTLSGQIGGQLFFYMHETFKTDEASFAYA